MASIVSRGIEDQKFPKVCDVRAMPSSDSIGNSEALDEHFGADDGFDAQEEFEDEDFAGPPDMS